MKRGNAKDILVLPVVLGIGMMIFLVLFLLKNSEVAKLNERITEMQKDHAAEITRLYKEMETLEKKAKDYDRLKEKYTKLNSQKAIQTITKKTEVVKEASEEAGTKLGEARGAKELAFAAQHAGDLEMAESAADESKKAMESAKNAANRAEETAKEIATAAKQLEDTSKVSESLNTTKTAAKEARLKALFAEVASSAAETDAKLALAQVEFGKIWSGEDLEMAKEALEAVKKAAGEAEAAKDKAKAVCGEVEGYADEGLTDADAIIESAYVIVETAESQAKVANEVVADAEAAYNEREHPSYTPQSVISMNAGERIPDEAVDMSNLSQYFVIYDIPRGGEVFNRINGKSYRDNPDVALESLRYLKVLHRNYEGQIQIGEMVCHADVANDLISIFRSLFEQGYQIYSMYLVDKFWTGDGLTTDEESVRANNTSCFNYRRASDAANLSNHSFGKAIDVNPRDNPYVVLGTNGWYTDPPIDYPAGEEGYANPDTRPNLPHAMTESDACVQAFKGRGFTWGGDRGGANRDFQHFERLG